MMEDYNHLLTIWTYSSKKNISMKYATKGCMRICTKLHFFSYIPPPSIQYNYYNLLHYKKKFVKKKSNVKVIIITILFCTEFILSIFCRFLCFFPENYILKSIFDSRLLYIFNF